MRRIEGFVLPALVTLLLHAALLFLLTANWQPEREPPTIVPRHVKAHVIAREQSAPKKETTAAPVPQPKAEKPPEVVKPPQPKPPEPEKKAPPVKKPPEQKPPPKPPEKPKPDPNKARQEAARKQAEQERIRRERELALAMQAEEESQQAETNAELAQTIGAAISQAVGENWTPPLSARHDMRVVLRIQLIPTGEVVGVGILQSSGDAAFDQAAINAVNKAGLFPEVAEVPPKFFEQQLRNFRLDFRPEDLRL